MPIDTDFASQKPLKCPLSVVDIEELTSRGPWATKSEGELFVNFAFTAREVLNFLYSQDRSELVKINHDITGLRSYVVKNIPKGKIGGTEYHRIRREIIISLEGTVEFECEDVWGAKKNFTIAQQKGIMLPPFILHTYYTKADSNSLLVLCNTLYPPENPLAHDTYSKEAFQALQAQYKKL